LAGPAFHVLCADEVVFGHEKRVGDELLFGELC
jgi:hypothetical protein